MASYLTDSGAEDRLEERFGIAAAPLQGDLDLASSEVDSMRPFIGTKLVTGGTQTLAFPRSVTPDGETNAETGPPTVVLDRVALLACLSSLEDEPAAVTSMSQAGVSESYARPVRSRLERLLAANEVAFRRYLLKVGQNVGTARYSPTPEADLAS